ncbi:MAG TPA: sigma factor-like helix-turn-helix DNA-binding protein, partial [Gemmataceae bacterium]|nr:sigma factor-like helix-turn-helix DNA-binding protein [Gemmataceae bacterium]
HAIALLPHDLKTTLLLHHYQHLSCREIAGIVHCTESGVESRLYRARQRLRLALADFLHEISPC